ncbi:MAG: hypothetical protein WD182_03660 [Bacteroidota bacterium]
MRVCVTRWMVCVSLLGLGPLPLAAQCGDNPGPDGLTWSFDEGENDGFSLFKALGELFTPEMIKDTRRIRAYVRDERFGTLLRLCGDMRAVDAIYMKSLKITRYNISRALFLSMMATLEHRNVDVKLPVLGAVGLPLTFEEDSLFLARRNSLPSRLYRDTPEGEHGDKDKLQHFFASAYIAYASESRDVARASGNFVEWGEAQFIVGGVDDPRDKRANRQGERFGHDLITVSNMLPSDYFNLRVDD